MTKETIKAAVIGQIAKGKAHMRPRWHFVLKAALAILGMVFLFFAALYLVSFIFFTLRATGSIFAPAFGFRGVVLLMSSLPWLLIGIALLFIVILEVLVRHYAFAYRKPLLYSLVGILVVVAIGTVIVSRSGIHEQIFEIAKADHLPFGGGFYRAYGLQEPRDVHVGKIVSVIDQDENGLPLQLQIMSLQGRTATVTLPSDVDIPFDESFHIGDRILIMGEFEQGEISAIGIRPIEYATSGMPLPPR
jgi:hypothetical protein